ncbi:MAG: response regulator transcription factor [Tunicatimonas sp.]|uniref:LuxR C-terminal-related transcriptional regulator n=1 Tax=Tunicatimonas sp. TaxID=1940096 RepID=UPI003C7191EC
MKVSKVLIADKQTLTVVGIRNLLESFPEFVVIGEVDSWQAVNDNFTRDTPNLLLIDYAHLTGFSYEGYQRFNQEHPATKLIVITDDQDRQRVLQILQANTAAFLTKECSRNEILTALQAVANGQKFYCESVLQLLMDQSILVEKDDPINSLSPRELQIIQYIAQEISTKAIADELNLSPHTINAHRKRILKKLDVKTPVGLVVKALRLQLIKL